jgi:protein-S-isoprenylcysteine O-methyltransferase Ste14
MWVCWSIRWGGPSPSVRGSACCLRRFFLVARIRAEERLLRWQFGDE